MGRKLKKLASYVGLGRHKEEEDRYEDFYSGVRERRVAYTSPTYYSNFNWSAYDSYSSYNEVSEGKLSMRKPKGYSTPDKTEIYSKMRKAGHFATDDNEIVIADLSRYYYQKMFEEPKFFKEDFEITTDALHKAKYKMTKALEMLENATILGNSPMEKAISAFKYLAAQKKQGRECPVPIDGEVGDMGIREEVFRDAIYEQLIDEAAISSQRKVSVLQKLSLIADFGTEFKVEKEVIDKPAANSRLSVRKTIRDYAQLHMVEPYQRLMPNYQIKLLNKDLIIKSPIERIENKQKLIILVDFSGSMSSEVKQDWVMALMMDRLRYVIKGEAEVFFSFFVCSTSTLNFHHIHDTQSALEFWKNFQTRPNGGGTDIGTIINYVKAQISSRRLHNLNIDLSQEQPEILIVNDGQDDIHTDKFTYKTNALTLMQENDQLKDLCLKNGGKYVHITPEAKVIYN